jgi:hypothetical protein
MPAPVLLTIDEALAHLKWPTAASLTPSDVLDLQRKLDTAHELVLDVVKDRIGDTAAAWAAEVDAWTPVTAPLRVKAAILEMTAELDADRGDADRPGRAPGQAPGALPHGVALLLHRLKDPSLAV